MLLTLTEAAKIARVSRATLYKRNREGKLSFQKNEHGQQVVDTAELSRLYTLQVNTVTNGDTQNNMAFVSSSQSVGQEILQVKLEAAQDKILLLERHINSLQNTLEHEQERTTSFFKTSENLMITHEKESEGLMQKIKKIFK